MLAVCCVPRASVRDMKSLFVIGIEKEEGDKTRLIPAFKKEKALKRAAKIKDNNFRVCAIEFRTKTDYTVLVQYENGKEVPTDETKQS